MPEYVYGGAVLPAGKVDTKAKVGTTAQNVIASEWNSVMQAMDEIRTSILAVSTAAGVVGGVRFVKSTEDTTDRTAELNSILGGAGHIYLGPGLYVISNPINVQSNTHLKLHPNAIVRRSLSTPT